MKRIVAFFVVLCCVFSSFTVFEAVEVTQEDVNDTLEILEKFTALGIARENDKNKLDEKVNRASFAEIITALINGNPGEPENNVYSDVNRDYWASPYISYLTEMDVLKGYKDGKFYPEDAVKYSEAVKVLVGILGYGVKAELLGGYPMGYMQLAASFGINLNVTQETELTYAQIYEMLDAAIEVDVLEMIGAGQTDSYRAYDGRTVLSVYHNIYADKGIVTATEATTLTDGTYNVPKMGEIIIDDVVYTEGKTNVSEYLGYSVEFYVRRDKNAAKPEVIYAQPSSRNRVQVIESENINKAGINKALTTYTYFDESGRSRSVSLAEKLYVLYNGIARPDYSISELTPEYGKVTLIDNDDDSRFDVLSVFDVTKAYVVSYIGSDDDKYTIGSLASNDTVAEVKKNDLQIHNKVYKNGSLADMVNIKEGDTILIGENTEYDYVLVYASDASVNGKIEMTDSEGIVVDGQKYKIAPYYKELIKNGYAKAVEAGQNGVAYIDCFGYVQFFEEETIEGLRYGILTQIGKESDAFTTTSMAKIFTTEQKFESYFMRESIIFNGLKKKSADCVDIVKKYTALLDGGRDAWKSEQSDMQLVQYRLNADDEIVQLNTVTVNTNGGYDANAELSYCDTAEDVTGKYYWYELGYDGTLGTIIYGKYICDADTIVFEMYPNEKDCVVKKGRLGYKNLHLYNVGEDKVADVIVTYASAPSANRRLTGDGLLLVTSIGEEIDKEENVVSCLFGYNKNGDEISYSYDADKYASFIKEELNKVDAGDIIRYSLSPSGDLSDIQIVYDNSLKGTYGATREGIVHTEKDFEQLQDTSRVIYGKVVKVVNNTVILDLNEEGGGYRMWPVTGYGGKVIGISQESGRTITIDPYLTVKNIKPGDEILINSSYKGINQIFLWEKK